MITPSFSVTATERVLPKLALDFTTATLDPRITFTRVTDASNPATYINSSGVITAATNNQPRFDYDPVTLLCKGLLIEESRTNSLLNTDLLSTQIVTVTAAVKTLSFYGSGSVTLSGAHTAVVSGTGVYPTRTTYSFTPTAGALTLTVTGAVQYAQLEAGAFATSYIPTTSAALTRNADVATMTGTNFSSWFNATEGTFVFAGDQYAFVNGITHFSAFGNSTNYIAPRNHPSNTTSTRFDILGGANTCSMNGSTLLITGFQESFAYKTNLCAGAVSGGSVATDTTVDLPSTTPTALNFGATAAGTVNYNGHIYKFAYYPQRLINAEVQAFSKQG